MADNTQAQRDAVKRYQQQSESWTVRTNDPERINLLKVAKSQGNLPSLFFEFLEKKFK
mgnify:CR=1 FL=1